MTVYDLSEKKIEYIFREFDNVLVAFSGGKDSSVCFYMCYDYAKKHGMLGKLGIYTIDYEAEYSSTTEFVKYVYETYNDVRRRYLICLPIQAQCACNMESGFWEPWEDKKKDIWVRDIPEGDYVINVYNKRLWFPFDDGISDYDFQDKFCREYSKKYGSTAVVIGIREVESLNRRRVFLKERINRYKGKNWTTEYVPGSALVYPIGDWKTEDVWVYFNKTGYRYNKIYDLYYRAGLSIYQMRVASPFNTSATESLKLYKVIDPQRWGKMVSRVNGVSFVGLYGSTTAMAGYGRIKKPEKYTWKEYYEFLLKTLPKRTQENYNKKLEVSIKFWKDIGGILSEDLIEQVKDNPDVEISERDWQGTMKKCVKFKNYPDDLPECTKSFCSYPSYKRLCIAIMKNDYFLKTCGFSQNKEELKLRKNALEKYKNI